MLVSGDMRHRIGLEDRCAQAGQCFVLRRFKDASFQAFEFNANRVVIALVLPPVSGLAGMPCTVVAADKLPKSAGAADEKVRRNLKPPDALEVGMRVPVELIGEQALHIAIAELPWRQADRVNHDQVNPRTGRPLIKVGRGHGPCMTVPALPPQAGALG